MAIEEKDIVVEIEAEEKLPDKEVVIGQDGKGKETQVGATNSDFEALRDQLAQITAREEQQRQAREAAEHLAAQRTQEAADARAETERAKTDTVDSQYQTILGAITTANAEIASGEAEYRSARELGDVAKELEATSKIARANARLVHFETGKAALEERATAARESAKNPPKKAEPQATGDPFEQRLAAFTPRTRDWVRGHKEVLTDPKLNKRTMAAHFDAEAEGFVQDSEAYFQFLDKRLGFADDDETKPEKVSVRTHVRNPPAPVSRDTAVAKGNLNGERVKLSAREVQAAEELGLTPSEYARRKLVMTKEGRYAAMVLSPE